MSLSSWYLMVKQFHEIFGHDVGDFPHSLPAESREIRASFMQEEVQEFIDAETAVDQADALADLIYFALGTFVAMGIDPENIFEAVHDANMRKLWPDGKPRWRESDGKVMKPEGWTGPEREIEMIIAWQESVSQARCVRCDGQFEPYWGSLVQCTNCGAIVTHFDVDD